MKPPNITKKKYEHMVESKKSAPRSHIQKITAGRFFFPPCAYILSRYLPGKRNVYECGICFFTSCIIFISEPLHNLEIVFRGWQFWLFYYYILTCKLRRLHSLNMSPGDKIRTQVTKFSPYL